MAARHYELTDAQWKQIKDMISQARTGRQPKDTAYCSTPCLAAWADIPARYRPHQTVFSRFCKWHNDGTSLRIFEKLNTDADYENLCIDSTSTKAHPQRTDAKKRL